MAIFLVEKSGDTRQTFGPYSSVGAAAKAKGTRYAVVSGNLTNAQTLTRDELRTLIQTGSVRLEDSTSIDGI